MNVVKNIIEIRRNKGVNQYSISDALNVDVSVVSNIENGKRELKVSELGKIANALGVDILYLFTYPDKYEKKETRKEPVEAILQIKLQADKRDQILKLVFGDKNLQILDK